MTVHRESRRSLKVVVDGQAQGTGFPVGTSLVLTAMHVVSGDFEDQATPLGDLNVTVDGRAARLVWPRPSDAWPHAIDAALLAVDGVEFETWYELDPAWPDGAPFQSEGYPASVAGGNAIPVDGRLHRDQERPLTGLSCTSPTPNASANWAGLSGAPVIVHGRVVGVVVHRQPDWNGLLDAVPARAVLAAAGFRDHVPSVDRSLALGDRLRDVLRRTSAVQAALRSELRIDPQADVVQELLSAESCSAIMPSVERAHRRAVDAADRRLAGALFEVARVLVAWYVPLVELGEHGVLLAAAYTLAGVELARARVDGMPVNLHEPAEPESNQPGRDAIPLPPDDGTAPADWGVHAHQQLASKLGLPEEVPASVLQRRLKALRNDDPVLGRYYYFAFTDKEAKSFGLDNLLSDVVHQLPDIRFYRAVPGEAALEPEIMPILNRMAILQRGLER